MQQRLKNREAIGATPKERGEQDSISKASGKKTGEMLRLAVGGREQGKNTEERYRRTDRQINHARRRFSRREKKMEEMNK